jgi:hypothetical protein
MATTGNLQALSDYLKNPDNIQTTTPLSNEAMSKLTLSKVTHDPIETKAPKQRTKINGKRLTKKAEEIRQRKQGMVGKSTRKKERSKAAKAARVAKYNSTIIEVILPTDSMIIVLNDNRDEVYSYSDANKYTLFLNDGDDTVTICKKGCKEEYRKCVYLDKNEKISRTNTSYLYSEYVTSIIYILTESKSMPKLETCINPTPYYILQPIALVAREFCRINRWPVNSRFVQNSVKVEIDHPNDKFTLVCLWEMISYYGRGEKLYYYRVIIQDKSSGAMYVVDPST